MSESTLRNLEANEFIGFYYGKFELFPELYNMMAVFRDKAQKLR